MVPPGHPQLEIVYILFAIENFCLTNWLRELYGELESDIGTDAGAAICVAAAAQAARSVPQLRGSMGICVAYV